MKILVALTLTFAVPPDYSTPELEKALDQVPSIADLCGAVPTAPAKVRGGSIHQPVRREVRSFIIETNAWLDCAAEKYVQIQRLVDGMTDSRQRSVLVDHLNADFQQYYGKLNMQTKLLAERVNYRLSWQYRPIRPEVPRSQAGKSNSKANVLLRKARRLTEHSDINRIIHNPRPGLLQWEEIPALQFES
ncbi:hypothetical protein [Kordiimonas lipolytica]|nr:hypothetical protein [Kordiimonas lipolytica]